MCFDFRRARSHPLGPTLTSRLPGRLAMYTPKEVPVKVLTYPVPLRDSPKINYRLFLYSFPGHRLVADMAPRSRGTT
jgi:hypothetical protein